jgi:hypothetical protein
MRVAATAISTTQISFLNGSCTIGSQCELTNPGRQEMAMIRLGVFAAVAALSVLASPALASTVYNMDIEQNGDSAKGTITTDSTIGTLSSANILNFHLDLSVNGSTATLDLSSGSATVDHDALTASASGLFWDFGANDLSQFLLFGSGSYICFQDQTMVCGAPINTLVLSANGNAGGVSLGSSVQQIATVASTPLPATLPLLASALGGLGFVGWRRRNAI